MIQSKEETAYSAETPFYDYALLVLCVLLLFVATTTVCCAVQCIRRRLQHTTHAAYCCEQSCARCGCMCYAVRVTHTVCESTLLLLLLLLLYVSSVSLVGLSAHSN